MGLATAECTVAGVVPADRTEDELGQVMVLGIHMSAAAAKHKMSQQAAASFVMVDLDILQREQEMVDLQLSAGVHGLSHSMLLVARLQRNNSHASNDR